ncbi:GNAT family N-acetyltransferase [Abyssalbus ytuae]|uniref:GNAT family N-acetyltransferase n=1 Tax=Abyssalbus ytuae TaxID=2926907 RepID=A0A9E6ZV38_9FLAO|nr:GNAT family N-acetyltransferase [Abyssalbus ytuae]UOB18343.1 GNAT family N-acetyltransferase [Abyssalbus ytuae]
MISIRIITSAESHLVRHPVLRKGMPFDTCKFEEDDFVSTFHLGAFLNEKQVGTVTIIENPLEFFQGEASFQLRGMAVLGDYQKTGIGKKLVLHAEKIVVEKKGNGIWMNARKKAVRFYNSLGYKIVSDEFEVPVFGPHYRMCKYL